MTHDNFVAVAVATPSALSDAHGIEYVDGVTGTIELFYDVASPYAYLCATQIDAVAARHGHIVRFRPFLLGAVFKAVGNDMPARIAPKARWMVTDLRMWADSYGVPFEFPSLFPANTLRAMRACAHAETKGKSRAVAMSLFDAYWAKGLDPSGVEALRAACEAAELDAAELLLAIETQQVKDALRASTDEAIARGAFGAPTYFVGETMFWGNDRLPMLERFLESQTK